MTTSAHAHLYRGTLYGRGPRVLSKMMHGQKPIDGARLDTLLSAPPPTPLPPREPVNRAPLIEWAARHRAG